MSSSPVLHVTLTDTSLQQNNQVPLALCVQYTAETTVTAGDLVFEFTNLMFPSTHLDLHELNGGVEVISFLL